LGGNRGNWEIGGGPKAVKGILGKETKKDGRGRGDD